MKNKYMMLFSITYPTRNKAQEQLLIQLADSNEHSGMRTVFLAPGSMAALRWDTSGKLIDLNYMRFSGQQNMGGKSVYAG